MQSCKLAYTEQDIKSVTLVGFKLTTSRTNGDKW